MTVIDELHEVVRQAADQSSGSVVTIGRHGRGSGFVVAQNRVLTNAHNLRDRTTAVGFADGRSVQGEVVGSDVDGDLVALDVDTGEAPPLAWSDDTVTFGDVIVAVTAGRGQRRATWGQVSRFDAGF